MITATTLTGSSVGGAALNSTNLLTNLGAFTNTGAGGFALTNAQTLTVTGAVDAGTATLGLTTTGAGHTLTVATTGSGIGDGKHGDVGFVGRTGSLSTRDATVTGRRSI